MDYMDVYGFYGCLNMGENREFRHIAKMGHVRGEGVKINSSQKSRGKSKILYGAKVIAKRVKYKKKLVLGS